MNNGATSDRAHSLCRFFCALIILGTQIVLPVTPAFAQESIVSESSEDEGIADTTSVKPDTEQGSTPPLSEEVFEPATNDIHSDTPTAETTAQDDTSTVPDDSNVPSTVLDTETNTGQTVTQIEAQSTRPIDTSTSSNPTSTTETVSPTTTQTTDSNSVSESASHDTSVSSSTESVLQETVNPFPTPIELPVDTPITPNESSTTPPIAGGDSSTSSTSTIDITPPTVPHTYSSDSTYNFNSDECARVADGSFYCIPETKDVVERMDRVFAAPDQDGDSEIFIQKDAEITQRTFNTEEDAAPFYDGVSKTLVFHRLIDARYQIVSLNLETNEEEVLTHDSYNNMQPTRHGDVMVWQGWIGNDWEVVLREKDDIRMITDNGTHDIGPYISGNYIIWQAESAEGWNVMVYDMTTDMVRSIDEADGASIENPRLVLVYDAKHENGDVETRGYDLITEKSVPLSSEAPILPEELPEPDQTGEERALIVNATQLKTKTSEEDPEPGDIPLTPPIDIIPSTTSSSTLVIPPFSSSTIAEVLETAEEPPPLIDTSTTSQTADNSVLIEPHEVHDVSHIPDLVIPSITVPTDSQDTVAETH